jgi:hypothetical protein
MMEFKRDMNNLPEQKTWRSRAIAVVNDGYTLATVLIGVTILIVAIVGFSLLNNLSGVSVNSTNTTNSQVTVASPSATPATALVTPTPAPSTQSPVQLISGGGSSGGSGSNSGGGSSTSSTSLKTENAYNYYTTSNGQVALVTPSPTPVPSANPTPTPADDPTATPGNNPTPTPGNNPTPTPNYGSPAVLGSYAGSATTTVDSTGSVGSLSSLTVGADGFARIVYYDSTNATLKFVQCTNADCSGKNLTSLTTSGGGSGSQTDIAMDPVTGYPRIVYKPSSAGAAVILCSNAACTSRSSVGVGNDTVNDNVSIAVGSTGIPMISFTNNRAGSPNGLYVVNCGNANCSAQTISNPLSGANHSWTSIAIASDGFARVTYRNVYVTCTNAACSTNTAQTYETTSGMGTDYNSLAIDPTSGLPRVAYYDGTNLDLKFSECTTVSCSTKNITTVDSTGTVGQYVSMALGNDGFARISYYDTTNGDLKYAQCTNSSCTTKVITSIDTTGNVGRYSSIGIGSDGYARIAYYDLTNTDVKLWVESTYTGMVTTTLDSAGDTGRNSSQTIGADGFSRIAHWDLTNDDLVFDQCLNATCSSRVSTIIDNSVSGTAWPSIAMGSDGFARIAYYDGTGADLLFVKCTNATCSTNVINFIDSTGSVGDFNSMKLTSGDLARVSYYDSTNSNLKYAACNDVDCSTKSVITLDSAGSVGQWTSIALGSDGFARISYYDGTNQDLKMALCPNAGCSSVTLTTVDSTGFVGDNSYIAMGSDGFARLSYYDSTNGDLKYALCLNAACTTKTLTVIDSMGNVGFQGSSMTLGLDGFARFAYKDFTNGWLKYAKCNNSSCSSVNILTADSAPGTYDVGIKTSIVVGSDGWARISYEDSTNLDLKLWLEDTAAGAPQVASYYYSTAPTSGAAGSASTVFTVGMKDSGGNVITAPSTQSIYLYGSGSGNTFSTTSGGSYTGTLTLTITSGGTSADFYYKNNTSGARTIYASDQSSFPSSDTGIVDATGSYTVNAGSATVAVLSPSTQTVTANNPSSVYTLTTQDSFGNAANVASNTAFTLSDASSGQFSVLSSPFTPTGSVTVTSGSSTTTFYYKASVPGSYTITASSGGFTSGTSAVTVNQATITQYYYNTAPASGTAGSASTVFTVGAKDSNGNVVVLASNQPVYLYSSGTGGTFSTTSGGSYTAALTVTITSGSATTDYYYKNNTTAGSPYTLTASDNSSAPDGGTGIADATTSYALNAATASVAVLTPSTQTVTAGVASSVVTLTTKDSLGNTSNVASNTSFALSSTLTGGQFATDSGFTNIVTSVTVNSGTSSTTFYYRNNTAGNYTITAHAVSGFSDGTAAITVNPAAIASYYYATAPATGAAGASSTVFTVGAHDAFGNVVTVGSNQVVYLYSSAPAGTFSNTTNAGPFTATSTTILSGNTTADFYYKNNSTSGSPYTLTVSDNSSAPDGATGIVDATTNYSVTSGTATTSSLTPSSQSVTAGAASSVITLTTKDSLGNPTAVGSNTTFTLGDANGGQFSVLASPFTPVASVTVTSGNSTATFYYRNNTAGSYTVTAHNAGFSPDSTTSVTVTSAAISSYYFVSAPTSANISVASGAFVVGAHDVYGNVVTVGSNTTVYLYSSAASGTFSNSGSGGPYTASSVVITTGNTTATFYYKDPIANPVTITASDQTPTHTPDTGVVDASTAFTVFNPDVVVGPNMPLPVRSATLDDSRPGDPNVHFSWNSSSASIIKGIRIQVCTDGLANTACVTPTGADLSPSTLTATGGQLGVSGWAITSVLSDHEILITNATGAATTIGGTSTLDLGNFVNPTSIGTFFFRISTYTTTVAAPGDSVGYGAIGTSTNRSLTVTADVAESLVFRVANTISVCDGTSETNIADPNDTTSDLVTLSPNPMTTSGASTGTAQFCASTNAEHGYSITYADWGTNSYDAHAGFWNGSHQFNPGGISAFTSTPGSEQFGFKVGVAGSGSGTVTAPYNASTYNYNDSGSAVQLASATASTIANIYTVSYLANVSATTPGGTYRAHQMFVITATF